ncbi:MAG: hypothetical protein J7576_04880 [Siphonobacter aquaeclarae]|nr:hypothetical protein [Siphonobacter aquaeclarae]
MRCFTFTALLFAGISWFAKGQSVDSTLQRGAYGTYFVQLASTGISSSDRTPFWLYTNQYGAIPTKPQPGMISGGAYYHLPLSRNSNKWVLDGAVEGIVQSSNPEVKGILTEGYLRLNYKKWELYGGRKREYYGLSDTLTGMGSLAWSGNALPIPQIRLGTSDFIPVPFIGNILKVKGYFTHGWFENNGTFAKNVWLHSKGLYLRFGKESWPIILHGGFNHFVQWGGYAPSLAGDPGVLSKDGHFNTSLYAYWGVVSGMSMQKLGHKGYPMDDFISIDVNRIGNHLGTIDMGLQWKHCDFDLFFYRQSMFDDGSLFYLINVDDGLSGVRYMNKIQQATDFHLLRVTAEYLSTRDQGGSTFNIDVNDPFLRGRDNYFNHSQYQDGWKYFGKSIGTPFIQPDADLKNGVKRGWISFPNNRVQVFNVAVQGRYKKRTTWEIRASYSNNLGTYDHPYRVSEPDGALTTLSQLSTMLRVGVKVPWLGGSEITGAVAYDKGDMYDDTIGGFLSIRKRGFFGVR